MDIRLDTFTRYRGGKSRLLNALLAAAAVTAAVWLLKALWQPVYAQDDAGKKTVKAAKPDAGWASPSRSAYGVIVENDLFRPARQKYVAPPKPVHKPFVAPPPPPKPPPKLTLMGTVLLDNGEAAIMDYQGGGQNSSYYRIGDNIEGFVIKEIRKDSVLLERDAESLKVVMQIPPSWLTVPAAPVVMPTPPRLRPPVITPPQVQ
ncbi:MAG: hypothetical protein HY887_01010 [Deltaproteobacteria bacterium]|nr:hypothetical protein [Deltaproteobacteria bacterium]